MFRRLIYNKKPYLSSGFTLIEILVSILILCVGIFAIISMLSSSVKGNSEARKLTRAVNLASSKLDKFLYDDGICNGPSEENIYELNYNNTNIFNNIKKCTVTITWQNFCVGKNNSIDISTLKNVKN